jgi:hypothetical protein
MRRSRKPLSEVLAPQRIIAFLASNGAKGPASAGNLEVSLGELVQFARWCVEGAVDHGCCSMECVESDVMDGLNILLAEEPPKLAARIS